MEPSPVLTESLCAEMSLHALSPHLLASLPTILLHQTPPGTFGCGETSAAAPGLGWKVRLGATVSTFLLTKAVQSPVATRIPIPGTSSS